MQYLLIYRALMLAWVLANWPTVLAIGFFTAVLSRTFDELEYRYYRKQYIDADFEEKS